MCISISVLGYWPSSPRLLFASVALIAGVPEGSCVGGCTDDSHTVQRPGEESDMHQHAVQVSCAASNNGHSWYRFRINCTFTMLLWVLFEGTNDAIFRNNFTLFLASGFECENSLYVFSP